LLLIRRKNERRSETNVPQLPTNNLLGLGGQTEAPTHGLGSAHADRARSANPAEKRQADRTGRGDETGPGFGQELKNQLREQRDTGSGAAGSAGEDLPEGGKTSPSPASPGPDPSKVALAGLMPLPVQPHGTLDVAAGVEKALFAADDRVGGGAEHGSQRGLIAMLQQHPGAGPSEQMPPALRALANALATTSGALDVASFASSAEGSVGDGVVPARASSSQAAGITSTPATSPAFAATLADPGRMPVLDVDHPVGHPAWRDAVGQQVTWMVEQQVGRAELRLHPAHLGPIEVKVSVQNDQVNVSFHASHAATREALESSLPRLRELLGDSGLSLGQASVSQQYSGERGTEHASSSDRGGPPRVDESFAPIETPAAPRVHVGLLDAYA
jgi:flagellar hook-length control protein FliK